MKAIAKKILAVSRTIGHIDKNGFSPHFKSKYQAWDDVVPAVRDACAEHGLALIPSSSLIECLGDHVSLSIAMTLVDTDSGETFAVSSVGESKGTDDKRFQRAFTSAYKYLLLKTFLIPCVGDEDPDGAPPPPPSAPKQKPVASTASDNKRTIANAIGLTGDALREWYKPYATLPMAEVAAALSNAKSQDDCKAILDGMLGAAHVE